MSASSLYVCVLLFFFAMNWRCLLVGAAGEKKVATVDFVGSFPIDRFAGSDTSAPRIRLALGESCESPVAQVRSRAVDKSTTAIRVV